MRRSSCTINLHMRERKQEDAHRSPSRDSGLCAPLCRAGKKTQIRPLVPPPEINCPNKAAGSGDLWVPLCCTSRLRSWGRRPRCDEAHSCRKRRMGQSSEARRAPSAGGNAAGPARALNSAAGPSSGLARAASSRRWGPTSRTNASTAAALVSLAACRTATWPNPNPNPNWDAA